MKTPPVQKAKLQDWHRADIKAALEKAGWTLAKLGADRGYARGTLVSALNIPWPKGERIIANVLGITPQTIWPSRYNDDGTPISGRRIRPTGLDNQKFNTGNKQCNVEVSGGI